VRCLIGRWHWKCLAQLLNYKHTHGSHLLQAVRRLTPIECERLQGFPDNYTDIRLNDKQTPDGPRYKAMGNSMAVPVMNWIGRRIQMVEDTE
jgi:site-specific DNA-cytosine methylase